MALDITIAPVEKTVLVRAPAAVAFDVFTQGIDRWWPRDLGACRKPVRTVRMEGHAGGRWLEIAEDGTQTCVATIVAWDPPHGLRMLWHIGASMQAEPAVASEVTVRFIAESPDTTRVELTHGNFEAVGGAEGAVLREKVNGGWPAILARFAQSAESR